MKQTIEYARLMAACETGTSDECKNLIETHQLNVNTKIQDQTTKILLTPLQLASKNRPFKLINVLLEAKADPTMVSRPNGDSLEIALRHDNTKILPWLIKAFANHKKPLDKHLLLAALKNNSDAVRLLLAKNANVNAKHSKEQDSVLHRACVIGSLPLVQLLLEKLAAPDAQDKDGHTPLIMTLLLRKGKFQEVAEHLLDNKADVNKIISKKLDKGHGGTVLHWAARTHDLPKEIIQLLLKKKADINIADNRLDTPFTLAKKIGNKTMEEILKPLPQLTIIPFTTLTGALFNIGESAFKQSLEVPEIASAAKKVSTGLLKSSIETLIQEGRGNLSTPLNKLLLLHQKTESLPPESNAFKKQILSLEQQLTNHDTESEKSNIRRMREEKKKTEDALDQRPFLTQRMQDLKDKYENIKKEFSDFRLQFHTLEIISDFYTLYPTEQQIDEEAKSISKKLDEITALLGQSDFSASSTKQLLEQLQKQIYSYTAHVNFFQNQIKIMREKNAKAPKYNPKKKLKTAIVEVKPTLWKPRSFPKKPAPKIIKAPKTPAREIKISTDGPSMAQQRLNITDSIRESDDLLKDIAKSLPLAIVSELRQMKCSLARLLANILINQSQLARHPIWKNMRNTLHEMEILDPETSGQSLSPTALHSHVTALAAALEELIGLYKEDIYDDREYYLSDETPPREFKSPLLNKMAHRIDTRSFQDPFSHQKHMAAQLYWIRVFNERPESASLSDIIFMILSQIAAANEAGSPCIHIQNKAIRLSEVTAIMNQWRHRGLPLEEAAAQLRQLM
jgi:ankyrin repeat protein